MELGEARAQLAHLHSALDVRNVELIEVHDQLRSILASHNAFREESDRRLQDVRDRLDAVHRSWSWRLTAPARSLVRWMRGY